MGRTSRTRRTLCTTLLGLAGITVGTVGSAQAVLPVTPQSDANLTFVKRVFSARPTLDIHFGCLRTHPQRYCKAVEYRKALRTIRRLEQRELQRTHANLSLGVYAGWDVNRLAAADHWERSRLEYLRRQPTWLPTDPVALGQILAARFGWTGEQFNCLYLLWNEESGWQLWDPHDKADPFGSANGIAQADPASKYPPGWVGNAYIQIMWGLNYIKAKWGTPCAAWANEESQHYY